MRSDRDRNPAVRVMRQRDFRLLFTGAGLSLFGDQFALIATPWLVLQLTGDSIALGLVLALEGLPRAAFLLIGGVLSDRYSPRRLLITTDVLRLLLAALMAALVLTGAIELWMLYGFGFAFGILAGCAIPAENSIVPTILSKDDLQAGNSIIMGVTQVAGFAGPSVAGVVIGLNAQSLNGVGLAYAIDAVTFFVSAACLLRITSRSGERSSQMEHPVAALRIAAAHVWRDQTLRLVFILLAAINFLVIGPLLIGLPVIAQDRMAQGSVAFGLMMSAFAAGNLTGFLAAGAMPQPRAPVIRTLILLLLAGFGLALAALPHLNSLGVDLALLGALGIGNGYLAVLLITWMQRRTPDVMLGRVMSFMVLASSGLVPLSQMLTGLLASWDLQAVLLVTGSSAVLFTLWAATRQQLLVLAADMASDPAIPPHVTLGGGAFEDAAADRG